MPVFFGWGGPVTPPGDAGPLASRTSGLPRNDAQSSIMQLLGSALSLSLMRVSK